MKIIDLPFDILEDLISYLDGRDFIALTRTCKRLYQNLYDDSGYWRHSTIATFRVKNRPSVENDGVLWRNLYHRLLTQTSVYMWGQGTDSGEPEEKYKHKKPDAKYLHDYGVVSELQCGGWSTVFLNHRGELFLEGRLDGEAMRPTDINHSFDRLKFPEGSSGESTVIRQFSAGRKHLLGLADDGTVWLWYVARKPAVKVEFLDEYIKDAKSMGTAAGVSRVVAGWTMSSVYIRGQGIIVWKHQGPRRWHDEGLDPNWDQGPRFIVPESSYVTSKLRRPAGSGDVSGSKVDENQHPGEVTNYVVLDNYIVFCTDKGKAFTTFWDCDVSWELPGLKDVVDVQGAFQSLAFFLKDGAVITTRNGRTDRMRGPVGSLYLAATVTYYYAQNDPNAPDEPRPETYLQRIPALQNSGVIQIAFGDYHFHALHSNGKITSYGRDPHGCGALGLGRPAYNISSRGVGQERLDHDLLPHVYYRGRAVWLDPEQIEWAKQITTPIVRTLDKIEVGSTEYMVGEVSEWIEQQVSNSWDEEGISSQNMYFGLSIAAGGWRGGAVVLVPEGPAVVPSIVEAPNIRLSSNRLFVSDTEKEDPWKRPPPEEFRRLRTENLHASNWLDSELFNFIQPSDEVQDELVDLVTRARIQ